MSPRKALTLEGKIVEESNADDESKHEDEELPMVSSTN